MEQVGEIVKGGQALKTNVGLATSRSLAMSSEMQSFLTALLTAACQQHNRNLQGPELRMWELQLLSYSKDEMAYGFASFRGEYFPKPGEIKDLIDAKRRDMRDRDQVARTAAMLEENRRARAANAAAGRPVGLEQVHGIWKQAVEMVKETGKEASE